MLSEDSTQVYTPPPHIAARFCRAATKNRRSSAASSRRNSLSSTHSHHSHRSYKGCQSSHLAQHLRRTSIIETRKARLADKAAHAEKVRLRAALAKSAPRVSNSEERALAAQQARETNLARITATCAEEVQRAKKVAEEMKVKREADLEKLRGDMKEKLAEAERRREEILDKRNVKRVRATSMPRSAEKKFTHQRSLEANRELAATRIQKFWRSKHRRHVVNEFRQLGISIEAVRDTSFEEVVKLLSQDRVLQCATRIMKLCGLQNEPGPTDDRTPTRAFLSAFLILGHPAEVLSNDGEEEKANLIISFENLLSRFSPSNDYSSPSAQLEALSEAYSTFSPAFAEWKARDSKVMVQTMISQFVELDVIWQKIKAGEEIVAESYKDAIRSNQTLILSRIGKLAGKEVAKNMILLAIREGKKRVGKTPASTKATQPRSSQDRPEPSLLKGSPSPSATSSLLESSSQPKKSFKVSLGGQGGLEGFGEFASMLPENRVMVHELAIDKDYIIGTNTRSSELRRKADAEFFEAMRSDYEQGRGEMWVVAMSNRIRDKLLRLLTPGNSLHTFIKEQMDSETVQSDFTIGKFSYQRFFSFIYSLIPKLCAPFRDLKVRELAKDDSQDAITRLQQLVELIDLMSIDYANFMLVSAKEALIEQAPGYEQRQFAADLQNGAISLQKTKHWWFTAKDALVAEARKRDPQGINYSVPSLQEIYFQGIVNLAFNPCKLSEDQVPETFHLDLARISRIRNGALMVNIIASILLTSKNLLRRDVCEQWRSEVSRISEALADASFNFADPVLPSRILSIIEASYSMPDSTKAQITSISTRILSEAHAGTQISYPVMRLLYQRVKTHVHVRLAASSDRERTRLSSMASESLAKSGLAEFVFQINSFVDELSRLGVVDRASHGPWYEEVAAEGKKAPRFV
ncbi:MAG: hypothetical protein M1829_003108 [Trizodia sp. TS-e1964]|nr:MAG: hypothetical protein M1829_003108 [Trizodia sp. TS-e1964]